MANDYFDIVVVVPLEEELLEFMAVFPSLEDRSDETTFCHVVDSGAPEIRMLVLQQHGMGKTYATNAAAIILAKYDVGLIICLGIAGSLSDDMHLGDVCYTGRVVDVLDNAKIVDADEKATTADTELGTSVAADTARLSRQAL